MISSALKCVAEQLNEYLVRQFDLTERIVVLSNVSDMNGHIEDTVHNKIAFTLINVVKDTSTLHREPYGASNQRVDTTVPLFVNLYILVSANFFGSNYTESLKFISTVISFFQSTPVFDRYNSPSIDSRIEKMVIEFENTSIQELHSIWGALGGKYMPSVMYRLGVLPIGNNSVRGVIPVMTTPNGRVTTR